MRALANEGLATTPPTSLTNELEVVGSLSLSIPMPFAFREPTEVGSDVDGVPRRVLFAFDDDDDPGPLSPDCVPLKLEFGAEVGDTFEGFEVDDNAASLSTLFKNGLGEFVRKAVLGRRMALWYWNR